jgi:hypothetical protein
MLIEPCQKCFGTVAENQMLYNISINEGGLVRHMRVCYTCYTVEKNKSQSNLLCERKN